MVSAALKAESVLPPAATPLVEKLDDSYDDDEAPPKPPANPAEANPASRPAPPVEKLDDSYDDDETPPPNAPEASPPATKPVAPPASPSKPEAELKPACCPNELALKLAEALAATAGGD